MLAGCAGLEGIVRRRPAGAAACQRASGAVNGTGTVGPPAAGALSVGAVAACHSDERASLALATSCASAAAGPEADARCRPFAVAPDDGWIPAAAGVTVVAPAPEAKADGRCRPTAAVAAVEALAAAAVVVAVVAAAAAPDGRCKPAAAEAEADGPCAAAAAVATSVAAAPDCADGACTGSTAVDADVCCSAVCTCTGSRTVAADAAGCGSTELAAVESVCTDCRRAGVALAVTVAPTARVIPVTVAG